MSALVSADAGVFIEGTLLVIRRLTIWLRLHVIVFGSLVALQVAFVARSVVADVAFERLLARVHAHVAHQKTLPFEDLCALLTFVYRRTAVAPAVHQVSVFFHRESVSELLAAA